MRRAADRHSDHRRRSNSTWADRTRRGEAWFTPVQPTVRNPESRRRRDSASAPLEVSYAAVRPAAALRLGLAGADECARESAIDPRGEAVDIDALLRQERPRIVHLVDAPGLDLDIGKA